MTLSAYLSVVLKNIKASLKSSKLTFVIFVCFFIFTTIITIYVLGKYNGLIIQTEAYQKDYRTYTLKMEDSPVNGFNSSLDKYIVDKDVSQVELIIYKDAYGYESSGTEEIVWDYVSNYLCAFGKDEEKAINMYLRDADIKLDYGSFLKGNNVVTAKLNDYKKYNALKIQNNEFSVVQSFAKGYYGMDYSVIPFESVIKNNLQIEEIKIRYHQILNENDMENKAALIKADFPGFEVNMPVERDKSVERMISAQSILAYLLVILSAVNYIFLFSYLIKKRKTALGIYSLCGCSAGNRFFILMGEMLLIFLCQFALAFVLFEFWLKHIVISLDSYLLYTFDADLYILTFVVSLVITVLMTVPVILKSLPSKKPNKTGLNKVLGKSTREKANLKTKTAVSVSDMKRDRIPSKSGLFFIGHKQFAATKKTSYIIILQLALAFVVINMVITSVNQVFDIVYTSNGTYKNALAVTENVDYVRQYGDEFYQKYYKNDAHVLKMMDNWFNQFCIENNIVIDPAIKDEEQRSQAQWDIVFSDEQLYKAYDDYMQIMGNRFTLENGYQSVGYTLIERLSALEEIQDINVVYRYYGDGACFYFATPDLVESLNLKTENNQSIVKASQGNRLYGIYYPSDEVKNLGNEYKIGDIIQRESFNAKTETNEIYEVEIIDVFEQPSYLLDGIHFSGFNERYQMLGTSFLESAEDLSDPTVLTVLPEDYDHEANQFNYPTDSTFILVHYDENLSEAEVAKLVSKIGEFGGNALDLESGKDMMVDMLWIYLKQNAVMLFCSCLLVIISMVVIVFLTTTKQLRNYSIFELCGGNKKDILISAVIAWLRNIIIGTVLGLAVLFTIQYVNITQVRFNPLTFIQENNFIITGVYYILLLLIIILIPLFMISKISPMKLLRKADND